jgi:DNA-binding winged helix-turn-helix (wHTH) protein/TolB-like protein/Tfp pilus assembly protein PilF
MGKVIEHRIYQVDDFRIDVAHLMLYHRGAEIPLAPKAVETLLVLIERRGEIVSKDELLEAVWPNAVVEESNLFLYLSLLRKTLGTQKDGSPYVETLRRRGYRFNGEVNLVGEERKDGPSSNGDEWVPAELSATTDRPLENAEPAVDRLTSVGDELKRSKTGYALPALLAVILLAGVLAVSFYWRSRRVAATNLDKPKSIAILPFRSLVADNRDDSLELGMADTLITKLGNIRSIIVLPISSVCKFNGPDNDAIQAGQKLEVEWVLDAHQQRDGDRIRVNVRLIRVADGSVIWTESFNEKYTDMLVDQGVIATRIASALKPQLTNDERTLLGKRYTNNAEASEFDVFCRVNRLKVTKEGLNKALEFYGEAIKADPKFALAYAHMAEAYRTLGQVGFANRNEVWPKAFQLAQKALEIDSSLGEAHLQVAIYEPGYLRNRTDAETKFKQVIEMNPNDFQVHLGYAFLLSDAKRHEEAIAEAQRARELSPMTPLVFALESQILLTAGREHDAILQAKKALDLDSNFWVAHLHLGRAYLGQKRYDEAIAEFETAKQLAPESYAPQESLARSFVLRGDHKKAYATVRELESRRSERYVPLVSLAAIYSRLGNKDHALELLERAVVEHDIHGNLNGPFFDNLRSEPRFQNILRRINLNN